MIVLAGGDLVLPDRVLSRASLLLDRGRIVAIDRRTPIDPAGATFVDVSDSLVVPGFIDVHVHGIEGVDTLDGGDSVATIASRLPRYGVTSFCPTTVACPPAELKTFTDQVRRVRGSRPTASARVLPAHLESNFINPQFRGAQPVACLRSPAATVAEGDFAAGDILGVIAGSREEVGIVTLAPELPGGIELVAALVDAGHRVSLGHSGADFDTAVAAIEAGARHATHLFNRMTPLGHRAPGLAGAVLAREEVAAELICDGFHVHQAMGRVGIAAKGVDRMLAITDASAGAGLPVGATARLGGQTIQVRAHAAFLADGTLAGSTLTMDRAFANLVSRFGVSVVDAARLCSTNAARELGLQGYGVIAEESVADLVVLDRDFRVRQTWLGGAEIFRRQ